MSGSQISLYANSSNTADLSTFNFVQESDGSERYVPASADPLGEQRLFVQVTIVGVGAATGTDGSGSSIPANEAFTNVASQASSAHLLVDTGSWATVIPEAVVAAALPGFDPSDYPAGNVSYSSSEVGINGVWVPLQLQFTTTDGSTAITTVPVLVDTDASPAYMMGVGFDIGLGKESTAQKYSTANNAFLNLDGMKDGTMTAGYVINTTGIHLGLSQADVGSGWAFQKLQPSTNAEPAGSPSDWQPATVSGSVNGIAVAPGALLVDTGLANSYVETTDALSEPTSGTPVTLNLLGTDGAVSYRYTLDGDSSQAPSRGSVSPALLTRASDTGGTFVNTGGHFLSGFNYLYDATNGYVGVQTNGAGSNTDISFSPLLSVSGTVPLPDGFATSLPVLLTGDTQLNAAGAATLSGGLSGAGTLTISGGTVQLSGSSTLDGNVALSGGATLALQSADALGSVDNQLYLGAGTTLELADGVNVANTVVLNGPATVFVAAGSQATLSGAVEGSATEANALVVTGGGTLTLNGAVSGQVAVSLQGAGTLRAGDGAETLAALGAGGELIGGAGHTTLLGSATGATTLTGGTGGNLLVAEGGPTLIQGGSGHDTVQAAHGDVTVLAGAGGTLAAFGDGEVTYVGTGADTIIAGAGASTVWSGANSLLGLGTGAAVVVAGSGSVVIGGAGSALVAAAGAGSTVFEGAGQTVFIGGSGTSVVASGTGSATVFGGTGGGVFAGGTGGNNVLIAGQGASTLFGGGSGDVLYAAGSGGDVLAAGLGNETLQGAYSTGNNTYFAGAGTTLIGLGGGQDQVIAGSGASTVVAGTGADTFTFNNGQAGGTQTIIGFKLGTDRLDLEGYAPGEATRALANATGSSLTLSDNTRIEIAGLGSLNSKILE